MTFSSEHDERSIPPAESSRITSVEGESQPFSVTSEVLPPENLGLESLTLAEAFRQFLHYPRETARSLRQIIGTPKDKSLVVDGNAAAPQVSRSTKPIISKSVSNLEQVERQREVFLLSIRVVAFGLAVFGNWIMSTDRNEATGLSSGLVYLLVAFGIWIAGDLFTARSATLQQVRLSEAEIDVVPNKGLRDRIQTLDFMTLGLRLLGAASATVMSLITFSATANNRFTIVGLLTWFASILLWVIVLAPSNWGIMQFIDAVRKTRLPKGWTVIPLLVIMFVALIFRFAFLSTIPAEMTSDHVEKILDAQSILSGNPQVFFPNNGGREPIQFYLMALISHLPGLGLNFYTLKFLTAVEGLICIPILWWMGREIIGEDDPRLGNMVGLLLAGLVAVSYWHTMLSRLGLRIVLTVIVTAVLVIYLSRGMRRNQRGDFIKAGLVLGFGVYAYQAVRMLPVVVVAGVVLAMIFAIFRANRWQQLARYFVNVGTLVLIALVVFVPMWGFARDYPEDFWRRTSGRLLGDDIVQVTNADGQLITREATIDERMSAFQQNLGILISNIRNALLMYNWKGDVAWITAVPNRPEMDIVSGALLIVGLGAWGTRMIRRRDAVDWLMPSALFIMLMPSALSIAYPIENPSATRTSGSLPEAYLFAALPLALVAVGIYRAVPDWRGKIASSMVVGITLFASASANWNTYFVEFRDSYSNSSPAPYTEAGRFLRGFADSGGALGNAFMVAYPYWWDHRAVGIEAGVTDWPNGIVSRDGIPSVLRDAVFRTDSYKLDLERDLLFFYHPDDLETAAELKGWFPDGTEQRILSYKPGSEYVVFRVPKLGVLGMQSFEVANGLYKP